VCMGATLAPGQEAAARLGLSRRSRGTLAVRRLMRASGALMSPRRCCKGTHDAVDIRAWKQGGSKAENVLAGRGSKVENV
jgi:hypothetical protein